MTTSLSAKGCSGGAILKLGALAEPAIFVLVTYRMLDRRPLQ